MKRHPKHSHLICFRDGSIYNEKIDRMLAPKPRRTGYVFVSVEKEDGGYTNVLWHRVILETFVGPRPEGMQCAHLNGNPADNRLSNLRWVTPAVNTSHKNLHGTMLRGSRHSMAKLNDAQVAEIRASYCRKGRFSNCGELAEKYGVSRSAIQRIVKGESWAGFLPARIENLDAALAEMGEE